MKSKKTIIITTVLAAGTLIGASAYASMDDATRNNLNGKNLKPFGHPLEQGLRGCHGRLNNLGMHRDYGMEEILGLSRDELKEKIKDGKTMQDIITEAGYTEEDFRSALEAKREEERKSHLSELVESGEITQEEADKRNALFEDRKEWGEEKREIMDEYHADLLGMTVDELSAKLDNGEKMIDIIEEAGLDAEDIRGEMQEKMITIEESHLQELINNGTLTQDEADEILEKIENHKPERGMRRGFKDFGNHDMRVGVGQQMGMFGGIR